MSTGRRIALTQRESRWNVNKVSRHSLSRSRTQSHARKTHVIARNDRLRYEGERGRETQREGGGMVTHTRARSGYTMTLRVQPNRVRERRAARSLLNYAQTE